MQQPLAGLEVRASYERAEDHPRIFTRIHLTYRLWGELDPKRVQRAVDLSENTYCSVSAMLRETVEITNEVVINP
jgi:putative redox protein